MDWVTQIVHDFWHKIAGMTAQTKVVVGVSGGADSLALWHMLTFGGVHPPTSLVGVYLNHGLRPEVKAEGLLVQKWVEQAGGRFVLGEVDVPALSKAQKLSLEEAARVARYTFFAQVAQAMDAPFVVVAHQAGDQAETVLMHLLRGSGLSGLQGISAQTPLPQAPHLTLLRPFLAVSRADILAYCATHHLQPVVDHSNMDMRFFRNRLRHQLLPILREYQPQIYQRLNQMAEVVAADEALLVEMCRHAFEQLLREKENEFLRLDLAGWQALPLSLQRRVLRYALGQLCPELRDVGFVTIEQARLLAQKGEVGQRSFLPGGVQLTIGYREMRLQRAGTISTSRLPQLTNSQPHPVALPGQLIVGQSWQLTARHLLGADLAEIYQNDDPWTAYLQLPLDTPLVMRCRLPGERFQPLGMQGNSVSLKEFMINRKMPAPLRANWPLLATPEHLVWVMGYQLDHRTRVQNPDNPIWQLQLRRF